MVHRTFLLSISLLMCLIPVAGFSTTGSPPTIAINSINRIYEGNAPPPFRNLHFAFELDFERNVVACTIKIDGTVLNVSSEICSDIENPSDVDLGFSDPRQTSSQNVEYVSFIFEAGAAYLIELGDVPGCESPCRDYARDIVEIRVYADLRIERFVSSLPEPFGIDP